MLICLLFDEITMRRIYTREIKEIGLECKANGYWIAIPHVTHLNDSLKSYEIVTTYGSIEVMKSDLIDINTYNA